MKTGLVLEGGGMRSLFSEGFFDVMQAEGIKVDGIIGVSAGALFGCNFKSHQPGRGLRYNIRFKDDARYMGWRSMLTTGNYVNPQFAYHTMPLELDVFDIPTFEADPTEFHVVCTDVETGQTVYHRIDHVDDHTLEWFRATGSMPVVSRPVSIDGQLLLDGGMTDCIPLRHFQEIGYEKNIVILTRPKGYKKKPTHIGFLFRLFHPRHPRVTECMKRRHEMYNAELQYLEAEVKKGNTLLIYPDHPLDIGRTELNEAKLRAIYEHGQEKALTMLPILRSFLEA
ncbi:MAG: patatin family protein [Bacteroidaceae bacterium]|nr:patatin family protein [Bacteroidaceae bacterium]